MMETLSRSYEFATELDVRMDHLGDGIVTDNGDESEEGDEAGDADPFVPGPEELTEPDDAEAGSEEL